MKDLFLSSIAKLLLIFAGIYFFELAAFPLSIDEEYAAFRVDPRVWVADGRWGAYLVEAFLLPQPTIPFVPPAIFGIACAISYLFLIRTTRPGAAELRATDYIGFAIYCGFPTWFFIVEFYSNVAATGLGLLACGISIWIWFGTRLRETSPIAAFILTALTGAFAISIYQSFLFALIAMGCGMIVLKFMESRITNWRELFYYALMVVASLILYYLILSVFRISFGITGSAYIGGFVRYERIFDAPLHVLLIATKRLVGVYGFSSSIFGELLWAIPIVLMAGIIAVALRLVPLNTNSRFFVLINLAGAGLAYFPLYLMADGEIPTRALVGVPFAVWLFAWLGMNSDKRILSTAAKIATALLIFQSIVLGNSYQAANYFTRKADLAMATVLSERIANDPQFETGKVYALAVYGAKWSQSVYPRPFSSTVGRSFFEWDGGNAGRMATYMRLLGFTNLRNAGLEEQDMVIDTLMNMPIYPAPGSVVIRDSVVLARLGEAPSIFNIEAKRRTGISLP